MKAIVRALNLFIIAVVSLSVAAAHQQRAAFTTVLFNDRTGNLEVMHKVFVHDAEHAAEDMWGHADIVTDAAQQERFAGYVRRRFELRDENNEKIELKAVGHEIEGPYLWVYQEAPAPKGDAKLTVNDQILRDFWEDQGNMVNIEHGDFRGTLVFTDGDGAQAIALTPEPAR
ncbi:MAG: DUF6702 family protein [Pseudomonadota bacterium]